MTAICTFVMRILDGAKTALETTVCETSGDFAILAPTEEFLPVDLVRTRLRMV
jgi:hypothetical protein